MNNPRYTIIETDSGPFISESRVTVYDIMKDYDDALIEKSRHELEEIANATLSE